MERARKAFPILLLAASCPLCIAQGIFTATGPTHGFSPLPYRENAFSISN